MLLRPALAALALVACAALAGCDDGSPPTTIGNPQAGKTTTPPNGSRFPTYVALGDSFTAAPGVPQTEQTTGCLRSNGNYPNLLARQLKSTFVDVSCTGALVTSLIGAQSASGQVQAPQFAALAPDTSLVTIGIGGNELKLFEGMFGTCGQLSLTATGEGASDSPCKDYMKAAGEKKKDFLAAKMDRIGDRVTSTLKGIHNRSPQARVILVGYPQLVPAKGTCRLLPLAAGDYPYVRGLAEQLNDALRDAARRGKADFIDMLKASKGHDVCAGPAAWVNGGATDLMRALAFSPFAQEQEAVADLILQELDS